MFLLRRQRGILTVFHFKVILMRNFLVILLMFLFTACGTAVPTIKPFKLDIQQGNVVTSKMLLQLRPGMTKSQVRYIMGTPLIQDSFHGNRWDYFYQMREAGTVVEQRRVILDFENELLKAVRGDVVPSEGEKSNPSDLVTGTRVVEPESKTEEKSFFDKLKFWNKDEAELVKDAADEKAIEEKVQQEKERLQKRADEATVQKKQSESPEPMLPVESLKSDKSEAEKKSPESAEGDSEKSWWNKLKFWKGDKPKPTLEVLPAEDVRSLSGVPIIEVPEAGATSQSK